MKPTEHEISFEFPYTIQGGTAAYFNCRVRVKVDWGQKAMHYPPPGDPGHGATVEEIFGLEIDISPNFKESVWAVPDPALAQKIYDYLSTAEMQSWLIDKAEEDK